jgi:hypothetical protein
MNTPKVGPRGKSPGNLSLSRCRSKVKNKMEQNFEFGAGEGAGKGGMMYGGRSC